MAERSGQTGYINKLREKESIKKPFRQIDIRLTNDYTTLNKTDPNYIASLPPFMRGLDEEDRVFSFMINPSQMTTNYQKIINYFFTRSGWILEHVSDELPAMTLSGTTGSFKNPVIEDSFKNNSTPILTTKNRTLSVGFRNLLHLIDLYRNNGRLFYVDPFLGNVTNSITSVFSYAQRIKTATPVQIIYGDEEMYEGFFTAMSVKEDVSAPFSMEFSLDFSITRIYELWRLKGMLDGR